MRATPYDAHPAPAGLLGLQSPATTPGRSRSEPPPSKSAAPSAMKRARPGRGTRPAPESPHRQRKAEAARQRSHTLPDRPRRTPDRQSPAHTLCLEEPMRSSGAQPMAGQTGHQVPAVVRNGRPGVSAARQRASRTRWATYGSTATRHGSTATRRDSPTWTVHTPPIVGLSEGPLPGGINFPLAINSLLRYRQAA